MMDAELEKTVKNLIMKINKKINTTLKQAEKAASCERLLYLGQAKAFTDSLGEIIFAFDGSHNIYRQLIESGEIQIKN
ncbi:MAG: hypothetical protein QHH75_04890 [Bacillota bacterium]|jgi:hypothetical protein|nr:hypothetical protein [Bacillota bacterium]